MIKSPFYVKILLVPLTRIHNLYQNIFQLLSAWGSRLSFIDIDCLGFRWNSGVVLQLMSMMRDIALSNDELSQVIAKSLRLMNELEQNELPPLIYQLLLLSAKVHLSGMDCGFSFFVRSIVVFVHYLSCLRKVWKLTRSWELSPGQNPVSCH